MCECSEMIQGDFGESRQRSSCYDKTCVECAGTIPRGTMYWYFVGKHDGRFWNASVCYSCNREWLEILAILDKHEGPSCQCLGRLQECIQHAFDREYLDIEHPLVQAWKEKLTFSVLDLDLSEVPGLFPVPENQLAFSFMNGA